MRQPAFLRVLLTFLTLLFAVSFTALAQEGVVNVPSSQPLSRDQERQVERISMKLHCPICSGESIVQSQTDISRQMVNQVREMVRQGKSEREILDFFVASYGDRILMEPPRRGITAMLWLLPLAFLLLGAYLLVGYLRRASRTAPLELSAEDEQRIQDLLTERQ